MDHQQVDRPPTQSDTKCHPVILNVCGLNILINCAGLHFLQYEMTAMLRHYTYHYNFKTWKFKVWFRITCPILTLLH